MGPPGLGPNGPGLQLASLFCALMGPLVWILMGPPLVWALMGRAPGPTGPGPHGPSWTLDWALMGPKLIHQKKYKESFTNSLADYVVKVAGEGGTRKCNQVLPITQSENVIPLRMVLLKSVGPTSGLDMLIT